MQREENFMLSRTTLYGEMPIVVNAPHYNVPNIMRKLGANNCVVVTRGSDWGNPFIMDQESDRNKVCDLFEKYAQWRLTVEPEWLVPLRGKHLLCCCAPKRCHADTLLRLANE